MVLPGTCSYTPTIIHRETFSCDESWDSVEPGDPALANQRNTENLPGMWCSNVVCLVGMNIKLGARDQLALDAERQTNSLSKHLHGLALHSAQSHPPGVPHCLCGLYHQHRAHGLRKSRRGRLGYHGPLQPQQTVSVPPFTYQGNPHLKSCTDV